MMKGIIVLFLVFSNISVAQHDHSGHNWLGDKKAYRSVATHRFFSQKKISEPDGIGDLFVKEMLQDLNRELIDLEFFRARLSEFAGEERFRYKRRSVSLPKKRCTKDEMNKVVIYLMNEYKKLGFTVKKLDQYEDERITNFSAYKKGSDTSKTLVVSSHIDSVCNNGVNDDGTGTIAALTVAKAIASFQTKYSVAFVGFDREEVGLVGSKAFVKALKKPENIIADIQLEMMGTDSDQDSVFHVIDCNRDDSNYITDLMAKNIIAHKIPVKINEACTTRSDHASFWKANIPAVVLSENFFGGDSDRCYHRRCDVLDERIDFGYMGSIAEVIARTVLNILEPLK